MRLVQLLPQRLRTAAPEVLKFGTIGGLNVIVNAVVFNLLLFLPAFSNGQLKAKVLATAVAIISSYFMNRHWTYKDRDKSAAHREFVLFLGFNLAGMLIELAIMAATKYVLGLTSLLAINAAFFLGLALGTIFRFFTYRTWVFTHAEDAEPAAHAMGFDELTAPLEAEFERERGLSASEREVPTVDPAPARTR